MWLLCGDVELCSGGLGGDGEEGELGRRGGEGGVKDCDLGLK